MFSLEKAMQKIDYFTDYEKELANKHLIENKVLVTREQLFKEMVTKTRMESKRDLGLLTTYYSKTMSTKSALDHLANKINYYTAVSPHTLKEIRQSDNLILNFRDAQLKLNLPAICLVIIPNYYPTSNNRKITELEIINYAALEALTYLGE